MVTVLLVGIPLACLSAKLDNSRRQRQAVDAIVRAGGWVYYDYQFDEHGDMPERAQPRGPRQFRRILGDDLFNKVVVAHLRNGGLEHLTSLIAVREVSVYYPLTSADMPYVEQLAQLKHLRSLGIMTHEDDAIVDHFASLRQLRFLRLDDSSVSPSGLERLQAALPDCVVSLGRSGSEYRGL